IGTAGTKLSAAAKNPATYKKAMKGAAMYGGLALASGGLAVPAAVMGGRALIKHRQNITGGVSGAASTGAGALTGLAKSAYRAGVPEMSREDRQEAIQSMETEARIPADQSTDQQAPITELAQGLPVVQERQLAAELRDATASYDAFEAENGRAPGAGERAAMVEDLPFYASMNSDTELRELFEQRVAEETRQAHEIFDAHLSAHGEQLSAEQMRTETADLPFYAQSVRGLDPRQTSLPLSGMGNDAAPRSLDGPEIRSFDPLTSPAAASGPAAHGTIDPDPTDPGRDSWPATRQQIGKERQTMNTQPRAPMGTPEGGQFAATSRPDAAADVTLVPMNSDGSHGSIYFPERLHSADEHLQWWSTLPVPDEVLQTGMDDYSNCRVVTINSIVGKWEAPPKQPGWSKAEYEARAKESAQQHNQRYAQWEQRVPEKLDRFAVRDAVRMHLAWTYRYTLPAEEQTLLEQTQITVGDITGTPAEVSTHYAMPGFAARHPEALTRLPDDNAKVLQQLAQLRSQVETFG